MKSCEIPVRNDLNCCVISLPRRSISGPCQLWPEQVAKALFRDLRARPGCIRAFKPNAKAKNAPVAQLDRAPDYESGGQEFESLRARHFGTELGTPKPVVFALEAATKVLRRSALFDPHDAHFFFLIAFDALGERAEVIAAVAAVLGSHALAGCPGKRLERFRCDRRSAPFDRILGPLCVQAGLVARGLQLSDAVLQHEGRPDRRFRFRWRRTAA